MAEQSMLEDLTHCPICFNSFQRPKCLPCLHSFCESCLNRYILSKFEQKESVNDGFHCPICRHFVNVSSTSQKDYTGKWAELFPLNHLILTLLDQKSLQEGNLLCTPCKKKSKKEISTSWCTDCKISLCSQCAEYHSSVPILEDHKIIPLDASDGSILSLSSQHVLCEIHPDKKLEMYCLDHDAACCATCTMVMHRKCDRVDTLENVAKDAKTSELRDDLEKRLHTQLKLADDHLSQETAELNKLDKSCDLTRDKLTDLTEKTIEHLKNLTSKAVSEISQMQDKEQSARKANIELYKGKMKTVENCQKLISAMMTKSSNVQFFLESKKISKKLCELEKEFGSPVEECKFEFQINSFFSEILDRDSLGCVNKHGNTGNKSEQSSLMSPMCDVKKKEVHQVARAFPSFRIANKIEMKTIETSTHNSNVTSCLCLNDGRVIVVDHKGQGVQDGHLRVYTPGFPNFKLVNLQGRPWGAASVNSSQIAVTVPTSRRIYILETKNFTTVSTRVGKNPLSAVATRETLSSLKSSTECKNCLIYVSSMENIFLLNISNWNICQTFAISSTCIGYLAYSQGNLYHSVEDKLTCLDESSGKRLWEYSHNDLKGIRGIANGPNNDLLVCGYQSGNLFCVSKSGEKGREILKCPNLVLAFVKENANKLLAISGGEGKTNNLSQWNIETSCK